MISIKDMDMVMDVALEMDTLRDGCNFAAIHIQWSARSIELRCGIGSFCLFLLSLALPHLTCCCTYACTTIQFKLCFVLLCFFASSFVFRLHLLIIAFS